MATEREEALRKAEKLLRQGRLDAAIAEYERIVEQWPADWATANLLGDLYVRASQVERAAQVYARIADHFVREGFLPKAVALYKKVIRLKPDDEQVVAQTADIMAQLGLVADARTLLTALYDACVRRKDTRAAAQVALRVARLDPADLGARLRAAQALAFLGEKPRAVAECHAIADEYAQRAQPARAFEVLREAAAIDPADRITRERLVRIAIDLGELDQACQVAGTGPELRLLAAELMRRGRTEEGVRAMTTALEADPTDVETRLTLARTLIGQRDLTAAARVVGSPDAGDDPRLLLLLAEMELRARRVPEAGQVLRALLERDRRQVPQVMHLGLALAPTLPEAGFVCVEAAVDHAMVERDVDGAVATLQHFAELAPSHLPALLRLVDICVDAGLVDGLYHAQVLLADAYAAAGLWAEARTVVEDLVANHPDEPAHVERLRTALTMLGVQDIDAAIAARQGEHTDDSWASLNEETPPPVPPVAPVVIGKSPDLPPADAQPSVAPDPSQPALPSPPAVPEDAGPDVYELSDGSIDLADILRDDDEGPPASGGAGGEVIEIDLSDVLGDLARPPATALTTVSDAAAGADAALAAHRENRVDDESHDLESVFRDFRDELSRQNRANEAEEQFRLALTFVEMGMTAQAEKALRVAVRAPALRFEAASRLGRLARAREDRQEAIEWFERAAEVPAPSPEAARALLVELADLLEAVGERDRALAVVLELASDNPGDREVQARVARLSNR